MKKIIAFLLLIAMPLILLAFDEKSAKAVFESRCSICHSETWALERRKTKKGWQDTVERMRGKTAGNVISAGDQNIIVEYLYRLRGR